MLFYLNSSKQNFMCFNKINYFHLKTENSNELLNIPFRKNLRRIKKKTEIKIPKFFLFLENIHSFKRDPLAYMQT